MLVFEFTQRSRFPLLKVSDAHKQLMKTEQQFYCTAQGIEGKESRVQRDLSRSAWLGIGIDLKGLIKSVRSSLGLIFMTSLD